MDKTDTAPIDDRRLRVLFVTEDDPIYVIKFFEVFFDEYPRDQIEIIGVTVQEAFHEPKHKTAQRVFNFYGPADFARLLARYVSIKARGSSIARLTREKGYRVIPCRSVNDPRYVELVDAIKPDVIVSVAAPEIFRKRLLRVPTLGCINIHSGRLPLYRGMMPNFWQLLNGESHAVVTIHEMVEKLDAGDVIATLEWPLKPKDSLDRVITGTKRDGARLMIDTLRRMKDGTATVTPLDMTGNQYFSFPKPEDVKLFRQRGHRLL